MKSIVADKVVLVTGGAGSIGSEIVAQSLSRGAAQVVVFSRDEVKHFMMRKKFSDPRLETVVGDVRDLRSTERIFVNYKVDIIYHAAAMKHVVMCEDFPIESVRTNIMGTQNVVDLALKYQIPRMITISTDKAAYAANVMGACKFVAERITLNGNRLSKGRLCFSCVRFGNVANSRGSVIPVYVEDLLNRKPLQVSDPAVTRFVMEIGDAVALVMTATGYAKGGEVFILKMKAFRLGDLADVMVKRIAPKLGRRQREVRTEVSGLVTGEKLHEDLVSDIEAPRLYELKDMYVLLPDAESRVNYRGIRKARLTKYASNDAEMIGKGQIEELVVKYLRGQSLP